MPWHLVPQPSLGEENLALRLEPHRRRKLDQRKVFKFYDAQADKLIIGQGSIRIGTHRKYHAIENPALRDVRDGELRTITDHFVVGDNPAVHPNSPFASWVHPDMHPDISFHHLAFVYQVDLFMYCFSYGCSLSIVRSFEDLGPPPDRVAEIADIFGLAETLVQVHPWLKGYQYMVSPFIYCNTNRRPNDYHPPPWHAAFEKAEKWRGNDEGRIIFFKPQLNGRLPYSSGPLAIPPDFADPRIRQWFKRIRMPTR